ncbi:MAG: flagellar filament capping protein FliD [Gammaproteobacteria bacterium]|nr:flagellar filament capping protein FliD [Gammaproteobacteria bacterium]
MPVLQASGIGSGLDVVGLVNQLVAAERAPAENRIKRQESQLEGLVSAYGKLKSSLDSLQSSLASLKDASGFQERTASSADDTILNASATSTAALGTHTVTVNTLASTHKLRTGGFANTTDVIGSGTIKIDIGKYDSGGDTFTQTSTTNITITAGTNDTLEGVRDQINAADAGVTASVINDGTNNYLVVSSDDTGTENAIRISTTDDDLNNTDAAGLSQLIFDPTTAGPDNLVQTSAATDATFNLDGIDITSSSNSVSTALTGVTIDLKSVGTTTFEVSADKESTKSQIEAFVTAYNNVIETINTVSKFNEGGKSGALLSDSLVANLKNSLQSLVGGSSTNSGSLVTLTQLGYETNVEDGTLKLGTASDLEDALTNSFDDVGALIADYTTRLDSLIDPYLGVTGMLQDRTDGLNTQLEALEEQRERLDYRMEMVKERYTRQFTSLDALIASMNSTMSYLSQQLSTLPGART